MNRSWRGKTLLTKKWTPLLKNRPEGALNIFMNSVAYKLLVFLVQAEGRILFREAGPALKANSLLVIR